MLSAPGRLILNVPGRMHRFFEIMDAALENHVGPQASGFLRTVFSLHDPDEVEVLLSGAGFNDVDVQVTTVGLELPTPPVFLWQYLYATPLAESISQMDDEALGALEREFAEQAASFVEDGGVKGQQEMVTATGRK